jgi:alginate O-acetyltransferase complex protein AlgI
MSFEDKPFILLMLATYAVWLLVRHREPVAVALLVVASLIFYGHNHWKLLPILLAYCVVNWGIARWLEKTRCPRLVLTLGVTFNLLILCFYKYTPLVAETIAKSLGISLISDQRLENWSIPFGISFYAFTGIAYMVDVYRRVVPAEKSLVRYTLSATFFPHLVAGPILRANEFLTSLKPGQMPQRADAPMEAMWLIARGFFKKLVIANRIGLVIDPYFAHINDPSTEGVWSLPYVYLYALQIYFDFSAYTDLARGLGMLFGYRWPDNFNLPYLATNIADFWRRWHITLSRFLRDYLYIPLGGNRHSRWRTHLNLMITMLLGGLWHGASWSFLLWGGLHGSFLIVHKIWCDFAIRDYLAQMNGFRGLIWNLFCWLLTFHCVCLAWCFFRLTVLQDSLTCVEKWVVFDREKMWSPAILDPSLWLVMIAYGFLVWGMSLLLRWSQQLQNQPASLWLSLVQGSQWGLRIAMLLLATFLSPGGVQAPFIYFQF